MASTYFTGTGSKGLTKEKEEWEKLCLLLSHTPTSSLKVREHHIKGSVTIVGSGIKCVGQFTLEAIGHIKNADKVFYCVADPVTEAFIKDLNSSAMDLYVFYDDTKKRYDTYVQMAEAILHEARRGLDVVGVFYGHPGVFVLPSHRAIQIAKQEGIPAKMLPAPSAEDCLFADLEIDPSYPGLQYLEATDLLLRNRVLQTDLHVLLWQVGCIGDPGFRRKGYLNSNFHLLVDRLEKDYGADFEITHYIGAQFPTSKAQINKWKIAELRDEKMMRMITGLSTFYIPPQKQAVVDMAMAKTMGMVTSEKQTKMFSTGKRIISSYGDRETSAIKDLAKWKVSENYQYCRSSPLSTILTQMSINPQITEMYNAKGFPILPDRREDASLKSQHSGRIRMSLKATGKEMAEQFLWATIESTDLTIEYTDILAKYSEDENGIEKMSAWIRQKGYDTTPDDVFAACQIFMKDELCAWMGKYAINAEHKAKLTILGKSFDDF